MEGDNTEVEIKKEALFPKWFTIWFILSCAIVYIGGLLDSASNAGTPGFEPKGAAACMFLLYCLLLIIWKLRYSIRRFFNVTKPALWISVISGWLFAELDELVNFPFNPLVPGITLLQDILMTTPMYIFAHLFWYCILIKYRFSVFEAFLTGGISLGLFEFFLGGSSPLSIIIFPFMVMIHGVHIVIPKILFQEQFEALSQKETKLKYVPGIIFPAIGTLIGIGIAGISVR